MTTHKGFVTTLLVLGLPLFITCLMVLAALIFSIRNYTLAQSHCIKHSMQAQEELKTSLKNLLNLNPKAKKLRYKYNYLYALYTTTINPFSKAALRAKIEKVQLQRRLLQTQQKYILGQTVLLPQKAFYSFKSKVKKMQGKRVKKKHHRPLPLAVVPYPFAWTLAPEYRPKAQFKTRQALSFYWQMPLFYRLPKWIKKGLFKAKPSLHHCSATIKKQNGQWVTSLIATTVKPSIVKPNIVKSLMGSIK